MKKTLSIILAGAAITTAALAFAGRQSAASSDGCAAPAAADESCKRCCPVSCEMKADT